MFDLDDVQGMRRQDPQGMLDRIAELPSQLRSAWQGLSGLALPPEYAEVDNVVVMGMGGSAIGGDLVRTLVSDEARVPIEVVRDYDLPAYVGARSLVVASSYSGGTEETLSGLALARQRGAKIVGVTTGGEVLRQCREHNLPVLAFTYTSQPRAALGHSLVPLLGILQKAGIVGDKAAAVQEAVSVLEGLRRRLGEDVPVERNQAKQLALALRGHLPVVYGAGLSAEVARRWKGQFNENAKNFAAYDALPELNHNTVVGYEYPANLADLIRVFFLLAKATHGRVAVRARVTQEILAQRGIKFHVVESEGEGRLAQMLSLVYVGDYASYYLAHLNGVDPTPIPVIDYLKQQLAKA
ncbi:MAG: bifunctional phosphoglucose/phosphomannose isomerase [Chloroflexota bacterium]